jgi:serine/threonine protein kinase
MATNNIIQCTDLLNTGFFIEYEGINSIEIESAVYKSGQFGDIYHCISIDGKVPPQPLVIKLFKTAEPELAESSFNTTRKLQSALKIKHEESMNKDYIPLNIRYPFFEGAPQFSFKGTVNGEAIMGYAANNLVKLGYDSIDNAIIENLADYLSSSFENRVEIALQFVSGFNILKKIKFIHADIKDDAIFINNKEIKCAIIDYDGGLLMEHSSDKPVTPGTPQEFLAPEIDIQRQTRKPKDIEVTFFSDMWSVFIAIHYFLFGIHPLFFLSESSYYAVKEYLKSFVWPDVNQQFKYFNTPNAAFYSFYVNELNKLPSDIREFFMQNITKGYLQPEMRIEYNLWTDLFASYLLPPQIKYLTANKLYFELPQELSLNWKVENVRYLTLNEENVTETNHYKCFPLKDTNYILTAWNSVGKTTNQKSITVSKNPPLVHYFQEECAEKTLSYKGISWKVENAKTVHINHGIGFVPEEGEIKLNYDDFGDYVLTAESYFGVVGSATINIASLFYKEPSDLLFYSDPPDSIYYF